MNNVHVFLALVMYRAAAGLDVVSCHTESRRKLVMHLGMFDDLWSAASLVPFAREDGLDVFLIGNRNCPPFVRGLLTCHGQSCHKVAPCHSLLSSTSTWYVCLGSAHTATPASSS